MKQAVMVAASQPEYLHEEMGLATRVVSEQAAIAQAKGAQLICFPECFLQGYLYAGERTPELAISLSSPEFGGCLGAWAELEVVLVVGLMEYEAGRIFNTAVVVHRGELIGRYRKRNLLDGEKVFTAGNESAQIDLNGLRFGVAICNDLNDQRIVAENCGGASLLVCPCNNMMKRSNAETWKNRHHENRMRRARETGCWILSSDVTGEWKGRLGLGPTSLLSPAGEVVEQVPIGSPGMLLTEIPLGDPVRTT